MIKWSVVAKENYEKLAELMKKVHLGNYPFQIDIYLYPDGSVDDFVNVGGNSWLNDDHITVARINHEHWDIPEWEFDKEGNYSPQDMDYLMAIIHDDIDGFIEAQKVYERSEEVEENESNKQRPHL